MRSPAVIDNHSEIDLNTCIGPYTSIGDHTTIRNTEIENTIIMQGNHIDCGRRITDSLTGQDVTILNHEHNLPRGHKLIAGDQTTITLQIITNLNTLKRR